MLTILFIVILKFGILVSRGMDRCHHIMYLILTVLMMQIIYISMANSQTSVHGQPFLNCSLQVAEQLQLDQDQSKEQDQEDMVQEKFNSQDEFVLMYYTTYSYLD